MNGFCFLNYFTLALLLRLLCVACTVIYRPVLDNILQIPYYYALTDDMQLR
jgi:hypothetical protein